MKRYGKLFQNIISLENLRLAHKKARQGKTYYKDVQIVDEDPDYYLLQLHKMLLNKTYKTSMYTTKQIYEPKPRIIYKLPYFPDRIVHHAIMNILQPIWDKMFIFDLYSAIPGKGLHAGSYRLRKFMRNTYDTTYCLKFDISKFYPSINHNILLNILSKKIKCKDTIWLLEEIIRSINGDKNIPIGNYLSQYFSNLYLNDFDHWLKENKHIKYYIRYCDDGIILHRNKNYLNRLCAEIKCYLKDNLNLTLNPKTSIFKTSNGIDFLGYKHYNKFILLRKSSSKKFKSKCNNLLYCKNPEYTIDSIMSYIGWLKHCDSFNLLYKYVYNNNELLYKINQDSIKLNINNPLNKYRGKYGYSTFNR